MLRTEHKLPSCRGAVTTRRYRPDVDEMLTVYVSSSAVQRGQPAQRLKLPSRQPIYGVHAELRRRTIGHCRPDAALE